MLFKDRLRLRQDDGSGAVPMDVLRRLRLPMPEDVLEQFIGDHGIKYEYQRQYGEVDLHALRWDLVPTTAAEIIACSVYPGFQDYLDGCREKTRNVPRTGCTGPRGSSAQTEHLMVRLRPRSPAGQMRRRRCC